MRPADSGTVKRLRSELKAARAENERLRVLNDLRIRHIAIQGGGITADLIDPTGACQLMASSFAALFDSYPAAQNYVEVTFVHPATREQYVVTVHKPGGKTPHQLREEAERELAKLREGRG